MINQSLDKYPVASAVGFFAINYGFFITATIGLKIAGFTAPALALAGLIGRTTKRLRIPLHLALAGFHRHCKKLICPHYHCQEDRMGAFAREIRISRTLVTTLQSNTFIFPHTR